MYPIEHGLSWLFFSIGFFIFFTIPLKQKIALFLLFLIGGVAIGMYEHITFQDELSYDKEIFYNLIVKVEKRTPNPWNHALCLFIKNDPLKCPDKYDERWNDPTYLGE